MGRVGGGRPAGAQAEYAGGDLGDRVAVEHGELTALTALMVGLERSASARGEVLETDMEALPEESFPQFHALRDQDATAAWSFSLETLVAGLRAQISERATPVVRR